MSGLLEIFLPLEAEVREAKPYSRRKAVCQVTHCRAGLSALTQTLWISLVIRVVLERFASPARLVVRRRRTRSYLHLLEMYDHVNRRYGNKPPAQEAQQKA